MALEIAPIREKKCIDVKLHSLPGRLVERKGSTLSNDNYSRTFCIPKPSMVPWITRK